MSPLWAALLFFGVALIVCHAPIGWVKWRRGGVVRNKDRWTKFWECTDYVYLILAAFALIPAANEVQRLFSGFQLNEVIHFAGLDHATQYAQRELDYYAKLDPEMQDENASHLMRKAVEVLDQANPLLREGRELIRSRRGDEADEKIKRAIQLYDTFLSIDPPLNLKSHFSQYVELLRNYIQGYRDYANNLLQLNKELGKGEGELIFVGLAPYLLGLGLAIRIAKVTAKLITVEEQPKTNQSP